METRRLIVREFVDFGRSVGHSCVYYLVAPLSFFSFSFTRYMFVCVCMRFLPSLYLSFLFGNM